MANTKSARKRALKSEAQRKKNRASRSALRTAVKKARRAIAAADEGTAQAVTSAVSKIDASASKRLIHRNTAARTKSRLAAAVRKATLGG